MAENRAVITGGSSGLGFALAEALVARGVAVTILARDERRVRDAVERLRGTGADAHGIPCDVSRESQARAAFDEVAEMGPLGLLVNAAGVGRFGRIEDLTETLIDDVLAANLKGLMLATSAALPPLRANGGTVVSVLSSAALVGRAEESAYCAAKWGGRGFMEALRVALKDTTVRTLTVYPGGMRTAFWSPTTGRTPDLTDYMDPRDVAQQILRVALDPGAAHVTEMTISR
jgi:NAD(P)-dependent dehydrogenase (short-subunit alcohol dehydrogenase family)